MTASGPSVAPILSVVSEVVTASIKWIGEFVTVITSQPLLLIGIVLTFVGFAVGLIRRLMKL